MNEQDKQAFEAALNYAKAQNDMAHVERFDVCDFRTGWNAALEYARGQQEPVALKTEHPIQPLKADEQGVIRFKKNSIVRFLSEGKLNELAFMGFPREDWVQFAQLIGYSLRGWGTLSYVSDEDWERANRTPQAQPTYAEQCQAEGWLAVSKTLDELMPGWTDKADSAMEAACTAIRELAQPVQPIVEFGMAGEKMFFQIGNQRFTLNYEPDEQGEFEYMSKMLTQAFSTFTHGVKTVQPAVNEQLLEALKHLHHNAKKSGANMGLALDVSEAAIAAAEAAKGGV